MRLIFMGTSEFAVPILRSLIEQGHELAAVYTQPDKPKGRGYALTPPPVKELALAKGIPVFQPTTLKDEAEQERIRALAPDLIAVAAYGKILPQAVLDIPRYGCLNVHASLLPKYRGAAPIQWAVINGEEKSGVTIMQMAAGLDTGDMLLKAEASIKIEETAGELHDRLSIIGAELLCQALDLLPQGRLTAEPQCEELSCYAAMLDKSLCQIEWQLPAPQLHNKIRGLSPWPIAVSTLDGKRVKIHRSALSDLSGGEAGEIISLSPLTVACGQSTALSILEIQAEGGKKLKAEEFVRGKRLNLGQKLR
ncbi:MAG: methionyl-tRNA formyltransferase [Oscillospiraceae bacterium]|jgi:methionyl-tRNA formyltransferase|nr:methionyl-tRNA formyltransferase [Oscillospiraceae bacterium]